MRTPRPSRRSERGQGSLENIGVIAVAALLVVALVTVMIQSSPAVAERVAWGFCTVTTWGTGDCDESGGVGAGVGPGVDLSVTVEEDAYVVRPHRR